MALKFFEVIENSGTGNLPFLEEFLQQNPKLKVLLYEVKEIKLTRKGNGYLFITDRFSFFRWKNDKTTQQVLDALKVYVNQGSGFGLFCQINRESNPPYQLGVDFEEKRIWYEGVGKFTLEIISPDVSMENGNNPFLPPVP